MASSTTQPPTATTDRHDEQSRRQTRQTPDPAHASGTPHCVDRLLSSSLITAEAVRITKPTVPM